MKKILRYTLAASCLAASAVALAAPSFADCAQRCYAQENSCRRATADSPSCGAQLTQCLQGCRAKR